MQEHFKQMLFDGVKDWAYSLASGIPSTLLNTLGVPGIVALIAGCILLLVIGSKVVRFLFTKTGIVVAAAVVAVALCFSGAISSITGPIAAFLPAEEMVSDELLEQPEENFLAERFQDAATPNLVGPAMLPMMGGPGPVSGLPAMPVVTATLPPIPALQAGTSMPLANGHGTHSSAPTHTAQVSTVTAASGTVPAHHPVTIAPHQTVAPHHSAPPPAHQVTSTEKNHTAPHGTAPPSAPASPVASHPPAPTGGHAPSGKPTISKPEHGNPHPVTLRSIGSIGRSLGAFFSPIASPHSAAKQGAHSEPAANTASRESHSGPHGTTPPSILRRPPSIFDAPTVTTAHAPAARHDSGHSLGGGGLGSSGLSSMTHESPRHETGFHRTPSHLESPSSGLSHTGLSHGSAGLGFSNTHLAAPHASAPAVHHESPGITPMFGSGYSHGDGMGMDFGGGHVGYGGGYGNYDHGLTHQQMIHQQNQMAGHMMDQWMSGMGAGMGMGGFEHPGMHMGHMGGFGGMEHHTGGMHHFGGHH
jgi:hypothetical protein